MRRALTLLSLTLGLLGAPAAAQACERSDDDERYEARSGLAYFGDDREIVRTTVVLCDRRSGRERVLRRGRLDREADEGVMLRGGFAAGRRLVWVEATRSRGRTRVVLVEARAADRSTFRRRELYEGPIRPDPVGLDAIVTPGGTAATLVPVADGAALVLRRGGREVRELDRGDLGYLALEDGVTVRASVVDGVSRRYYDLRPPPQGDAGCPRRGRFKRVLLTDALEVTEAVYSRESTDARTLRACLRSVGEDPVVASGSEGLGDGVVFGRPLLDGDWVAVAQFRLNRHDGCVGATIATTNLRTGGPTRTVPGGGCRTPRADEPVAITAAGVLAQVAQDQNAWTVVAFAAEGPVRFDTGPVGSITNLRAEGSTLRWENAGQPRSTAVEPAA